MDDIGSTPIEAIDPSLPERFADDSLWPMFRRLRDEAPVHYCATSRFGAYWSITRYHDILEIETRPDLFSSAAGVSIGDVDSAFPLPMFIASDPPAHGPQRKVVSPIVAPANLASFEAIIRRRAGRILDDLPIGETFDWVDRVSIELTIQMLATLLDCPFEDRRRLVHWSSVAVGGLRDEAARQEMRECAAVFRGLWEARAAAPPRFDLISMLAHGEATRDMSPEALLGNIILLIVGGNDTTRNSLSGGLLALNAFPGEYDELQADPGLIASMVPEIIRWQSPVAHMRRTVTEDLTFRGQAMRTGDKVVLWYPSANRDERAIETPDAFIIDRPRPRQHLSFGFGIHRCVGNRLAELQLRIVWEEVLKRFQRIALAGEPVWARTCLVREIRRLPVRITGRQ
jgi:cytochrome P450